MTEWQAETEATIRALCTGLRAEGVEVRKHNTRAAADIFKAMYAMEDALLAFQIGMGKLHKSGSV